MNKIIELVIDFENLPLEDLGVSIMSLVDMPAIGINWMAFSQEQFVSPSPGEPRDEFISRCIPVLKGEGYPDDQAAAICYSYWEQGFAQGVPHYTADGKLYEGPTHMGPDGRLMTGAVHTSDSQFLYHKDEFGVDTGNLQPYVEQVIGNSVTQEEFEKAILAEAEKLGEEYNPAEAIYLEIDRDEFMTVGEVLEGINALDILSRSDIRRDAPAEIKYRYAGPRAQRFFCRGMLTLNKLYTRAEINQITAATAALNPGMGHNSATYSVWNYKGGVNCKHYWQELAVFRNTSGQLILVDRGPAPGDAGETAGPANNFWRFSADEQQIVTGPAMIPNQLIPRRDKNGNLFHVYFTEETVGKVAAEFIRRHYQNQTDINHNDQVTEENNLIESWIIENPEMDKATALGYAGLPKGTWMVSYKINNRETWEKIKSGELNGFSVTGDFIQKIVA